MDPDVLTGIAGVLGVRAHIASLQYQTDGLGAQLNDTQERVDFAERPLMGSQEGSRSIGEGPS